MPRNITDIVIHCAATPEGIYFDRSDIDAWHKARGWRGIGYHYVILLDGTIQKGREEDEIGAGVEGHNAHSIHVCYIGGVSANNKDYAKDTRTPAQKTALAILVERLVAKYPRARVRGHRDFAGVNKACPSFDAIPWWAAVASKTALPISAPPPKPAPPVDRPVLFLQNSLKSAGFDPGGLDGDWGPKTKDALNAWELAMGLNPTATKPNVDGIRRLTKLIDNSIARSIPVVPVQDPPKKPSGFFEWLRSLIRW